MAARRTTKAATAHPLAHRIPDKSKFTGYIHRSFGAFEDFAMLDYAMETQQNVLLSGPTGPGKSTLVSAYGAERNIPVIPVHCRDGIDPNTFFGQFRPTPDGVGVEYVLSDVSLIIEHGGVLMLEELNMAHQRITAAFHSLLDFQRCITIVEDGNRMIKASDDLLIVAAYNPGYRGTRPLNEAMRNRWGVKLPFPYSTEVEEQLIFSRTMLDVAGLIRERTATGVVSTPLSTNMLQSYQRHIVELDLATATTIFLAGFDEADQDAVSQVLTLQIERIGQEVQAAADANLF